MKKIIVLGNPHTGTSILKCIIGHIKDVYEVIEEKMYVTDEMIDLANKDQKKYILIKYPMLHNYSDYIIICIIRNPIYTINSMKKRETTFCQKWIPRYERSANVFLNKDSDLKNIYYIKYEEIFLNNFSSLKTIFDSIGFKYTDEIFNNTSFNNKLYHTKKKPYLSNAKEYNKKQITTIMDTNMSQKTKHEILRTYQINQPLVNNNNSEIILTSKELSYIYNSEIINQLYTNLNL